MVTQTALPEKKQRPPQVHRGGRPKKEVLEVIAKDDVQAFEKTKYKWNHLALYLADQALKVAQGDKKNIAQLVTSAAIAFDKAHGKRENENITISIPASLTGSIALALKLQGNPVSDKVHNVNLSGAVPGAGPEDDSQLRTVQVLNSADPGQAPGAGLISAGGGGAGAAGQEQSAPFQAPIKSEP